MAPLKSWLQKEPIQKTWRRASAGVPAGSFGNCRISSSFVPRSKPRRYVGGETHLYLGRQYRLKIVRGERDEVKVKGGLLLVALSSRPNTRRVKELVRAWYQEKAKTRFLGRFETIAPRFARLGYLISPPTIRKMSRRWGSYSKSGKVLLNPDLIRAPTACIDYVITHELAHIVYPNHGTKFFELIETIMPDWKERKDRLERILA